MHPPSTDRPSQRELVFPLLESLLEAGGQAKPSTIAQQLAQRFALPESIVTETTCTGDGQVVSLWQRHVRFARQKAASLGYVTSSDAPRTADRTWVLTDEGHAALDHARPALHIEILRDPGGTPRAARIELVVGLPTVHTLVTADSRHLDFIEDGEIPLIVTSCPYFDIKKYDDVPGQIGHFADYDAFLIAMDDILRECLRVLTPGGRLALNVGDVLRSRARHGEHHVLPLHADILARSTRLGFRALTGILWNKQGSCSYEEGGAGVLGTPGQPNGVIKSEIEHILMLRKPGPYRSVPPRLKADSALSKDEYQHWFRAIWNDVPGTRATDDHPAPFPISIPYRLIRMFSFRNDTVLDVFGGSGTTALAAAHAGRNSILVDVSPHYVQSSLERLTRFAKQQKIA